jgi:heme exporter protein C
MAFTWFHKLASPPHAYRITGRLLPWFAWPAGLLIAVGLYGGVGLAPPDYQQGDAFRIVYVHAPSAWLSMLVYGTMAVAAAIGLVWRIKLAHAVAAAAAPVGASFTLLALATGSIWGKPMWGTWWVWDARLTSELLLLLLYAGVIALRASIDERDRADRASGLLAIVGVVNLPIIHYSVYWWNTLHQGSTLTKLGKPSMTGDMLWPLLTMLLAFTLYFGAILLLRLRGEILLRERDASWLKTELAR